jgi:hypothetical protein
VNYVNTQILKKEEIYTQIFSVLFFTLLYVNGNADEQPSSLFEMDDFLKVIMWLSLAMAVVAHLVPKKGKKDDKKDLTPEQK